MSISTTALTLCPGDTIRFAPTGQELTVRSTAPHPTLEGVLTLTFNGVADPLNFTTDCTVTALSMPRTASVKCFLCPEHYPHEYDVAQGTRGIIGGICGPCNQTTTLSVLRSLGEVPPRA